MELDDRILYNIVQIQSREKDARTFEACPFAKGVDLGGG